MIDPQNINNLVQKVLDAMPPGLKNLPQEIQANFKTGLQSAFSRLDLVTREEFDAQVGVLQKTRAKLEALEKKLADFEQQK
ncbi:MAG: accessory factor UbiK family protein [Gammaproteobacteria bacterium]|nr:accessory factor UbiK family protein [Gammaproteobacteria bacterium]